MRVDPQGLVHAPHPHLPPQRRARLDWPPLCPVSPPPVRVLKVSANLRTSQTVAREMSAATAELSAASAAKVPVTVLTGFLGSGKTTLLNYILSGEHGKKIAVIENEFGEVGIDDLLVKKKFESDEEIFEMNNGCICCTVRGDLINILQKIMK